jgi:hypothetical protein
MRTPFAWLVMLLALAFASVANAQDFDQAERHFSAAQTAFATQHFKTAAIEFQAAYEITRDPLLLYNVAESWQKSGDGRKSVASYRAYLKLLPNATDKKEVQSRIAMIEAKNFDIPNQSADAPPPPVVVPMPPPVVVSPPPPPVIVQPPIVPPSPAAVAPEVAVAGPTQIVTPPSTTAKTELRVPGSNMSTLRIAAWITVGGTVALVTAGAIFGLAAQSRADEITRRFTFVDPITGQPNQFTQAEAATYRSLRSDGRLYNGLAIGFFSGAGACGIAAASLFVADYMNEKRSRNLAYVPTVAPVFGQGQSGFNAGWKF